MVFLMCVSLVLECMMVLLLRCSWVLCILIVLIVESSRSESHNGT